MTRNTFGWCLFAVVIAMLGILTLAQATTAPAPDAAASWVSSGKDAATCQEKGSTS